MTMRIPLSVVVLAAAASFVCGNMYDVVMPHYVPADGCKCAAWNAIGDAKEQARIDATWANGKAPADAGNSCAMPAAAAGNGDCDGCTKDTIINSFAGPWCYCEGKKETYCTTPNGIPEQINLQIAAPDVVVASFVTFDDAVPSSSDRPEAMFGKTGASPASVLGVSHPYAALSHAEKRNYTLHFVRFAALEPRQSYTYKVKGPASAWSPQFTFRAPYASGETRIGTYGDMGHSHYNCMDNLKEDCLSGKIDAVMHMGDHAYDMANAGDKRGDSYMNAFQGVLASCPWVPIIGNHEGNDGDGTYRYLNMTFGETLGDDSDAADGSGGDTVSLAVFPGFEAAGVQSTATTALGDLLSKSTLLGAASSRSGVPSGTSRWFSVNVGLVHIAAIDLNHGISSGSDQAAWLEKDLAAVDRKLTPWVVVTSHFPLYHASVSANADASAAYYVGEASERYASSGHEFVKAKPGEQTVGELLKSNTGVLDPLLHKYGVDLYDAGHVHDYSSTWPICYDPAHGSSAVCEANKDNFNNPKGTVHVTEGNGGVPGVTGTPGLKPSHSSGWGRMHGTGGAYGRIIAHNETHMTYEHVQNNGGAVADSFAIVQTNGHGGW